MPQLQFIRAIWRRFGIRMAPAAFYIFLAAAFPPLSMASTESPAELGIAAFNAGDYQQAVIWLEQALDERGPSSSLLHNLGVAHFRAGNYQAARETFRQLLDDPGARDLALYNLGLVALAQDRPDQAWTYFDRVSAEAESDKLVALAETQLAELDRPVPEQTPARHWRALLSLSAGYEDNLNLAADRTLQEQDGFAEALFWATGYLAGDRALGLRATALVNQRQYFSEPDLRQTLGRPGLALDYAWGDWDHSLGADVEWSWVGGDRIERRARGHWLADRHTGVGRLRSRLSATRISAGGDFGELDGYQQSAEFSWRRFWSSSWGTRLGYRLENNNRDDLSLEGDFFSVSPRRHGPWVDLYYAPSDPWFSSLSLEYRHLRYRDEDVADGESIGTRREERWRLDAAVHRDLNESWEWFVMAQGEVNRANRDSRDYERFEVMTGIERSF